MFVPISQLLLKSLLLVFCGSETEKHENRMNCKSHKRMHARKFTICSSSDQKSAGKKTLLAFLSAGHLILSCEWMELEGIK